MGGEAMTDIPLVDKFREDVEAVITRYRKAHCMTYCEVVGCIEFIKLALMREDEEESDDYGQ